MRTRGYRNGNFNFVFKDVVIPVSLGIEQPPGDRVVRLFFSPATARMRSLDDVAAAIGQLPGGANFLVERLDDGKILASKDPDKVLAIGSAFKLYVLATLADEKIPWDRVVRIEDRFKSLPSGEMRNWPAGSPVTVETLATEMISQSDNTAADHVLALVGRERVEQMLGRVGMKDPSRNIPFLSTRELVQLKADRDLQRKYLSGDVAGRRKVLEEAATRPAPSVEQFATDVPNAIDTVEWFASAADLCRIMKWFDDHRDSTVLGILAVNPGLDFSADGFPYVGYKGGSEPGVVSMTWLLHSRSGKHYAMSASWNDPQSDVDQQRFSA